MARAFGSVAMLPLMSSRMPRLTGTRSVLNCVTARRSPASEISNLISRQVGHEAAGSIGDRDRHDDDVGVGAKDREGLRV